LIVSLSRRTLLLSYSFFFQAEDGIRDFHVTGVQTCALPIFRLRPHYPRSVAAASYQRRCRSTCCRPERLEGRCRGYNHHRRPERSEERRERKSVGDGGGQMSEDRSKREGVGRRKSVVSSREQ